MIKQKSLIVLKVVSLTTLLTLLSPQVGLAAVLFQDDFDSGSLSSEWTSRFPANLSVQNGWLHVQNNDGGPRDAMALVHDGDTSWTDYSFSATADIVSQPQMQQFNFLFRTDGLSRYSDTGVIGTGYQLTFRNLGTLSGNSGPIIGLFKSVNGFFEVLHSQAWQFSTEPMEIGIDVVGNRIRAFQDSQLLFDFVDTSPILYGGVGVHTIWEAESRFDNVLVVSPVPEPTTLALLGLGLAALGFRTKRK